MEWISSLLFHFDDILVAEWALTKVAAVAALLNRARSLTARLLRRTIFR